METVTKRWKHGEIHPVTGMAFWGYQKGVERWMDAEKFKETKAHDLIRDRELKRKRRAENPEKYKQQQKKSYQKHSAKRIAYQKQKRIENPEKYKLADAKQAKKWRTENKDQYNAYQRKWCRENRDRRGAIEAKRRALEKERLHPDHNRKIEVCLRRACRRLRDCLGFQWDLDHILPLTKDGWHHHCNLQMLPNGLNVKKRNNSDYPLPDCYKKHID